MRLALLVTGETPGPKKIAKATAQGVTIADEAGFRDYLAHRQTIQQEN